MGNQIKLINDLLSNINGGVDVAAAYLGLSVSAFNDRRYKNKGTRFFSGDELLALQQLSGTALVAEYFAGSADCLVLPKVVADAGSYDLFTLSMNIGEERGKLEACIKAAIEDGEIDPQEEKAIMKHAEDLVKSRMTFVRQVIETHKKATNGN